MKYVFQLAIFITFIIFSGCQTTERLYYIAPSQLSFVQREMKTAGYWISRHPDPEEMIMSPAEILRFNRYIQDELRLTKDVTQLANPYPGSPLISELEKSLRDFSPGKYYTGDGKRPSPVFFQEIQANMNWAGIPRDIPVQYGLIVHYADQRILPTKEGLYSKRRDIDFDELQNSALDVTTPVAIVHQSQDKKWYYTISPLTSGWVEVERIALCSLEELRDFLSSESFVVVLRPKAEIFMDSHLTNYYDYVRMGVRLPAEVTDDPRAVMITLPLKAEDGYVDFAEGYLEAEDIHRGYLIYSPMNMIEQAFEMLNEPYGWGGMYGEQDCSRFLQEVFATAGIFLPRNSSAQAQVGQVAAQFDSETSDQDKLSFLSTQGAGGITILPLKGHIMLYLGTVDQRPFAIHAAWGYRQPGFREDVVRVINRVAVTDLSLGEGSKKGSLLRRIKSINLIR